MTKVSDTDYVVMKQQGLFYDDKPTTQYRGQPITFPQSWNKYVKIPCDSEVHILTSETRGAFGKPGEPSGNPGKFAWCRIKLKTGQMSKWFFFYESDSGPYCASNCAMVCFYTLRDNVNFCADVLNSAINGLKTQTHGKIIDEHTR